MFLPTIFATCLLLIGTCIGQQAYTFPPRTTSWGDCDPIAPQECLSPFPNSFYLMPDNTTTTKYRLNMTASMFNNHVDPAILRANKIDGGGIGAAIVVVLPSRPNLNNTATWSSIALSKNSATSPTVLLEVSGSGFLVVPHWVEMDLRSYDDMFNRTLIIHPAQVLRPGTRYIVALRTSIGFTPSPAFTALRDNISSSLPSIEDRRSHFENIFTILGLAGVNRRDVILAWDYLTASDNTMHRKIMFMRQDALSRIPPTGVMYKIS
eukprot:PhF_6_TR987/c0_g1_i3/m.1930